MKTIEERAFEYSRKIHYGDTIYDNHLRGRERIIYSDAAREQKQLTLEAFDDWLCRNSWLKGNEDSLAALTELREILLKDLGEPKKADKVSKLEVVFDNDNESAVIYINGERCDTCLQVGEVKRVCRILTKTVRHFISTIYD